MSRNGMKTGRTSMRRLLAGALMLACGLAWTATAANYTTTWKSGGSTGWWVAGDGDANRWYRFDDGWDIRREDLATGQWSSSGTKNYNNVIFANGDQATMTVNALGGAQHYIASIWFSNSTSRTFAPDGGAFLKLSSDGTPKIETGSGGTGTYTFSVPIELGEAVEFNPVYGNLTFNGNITNAGNWIDVYGNLQKTLTIGGVLSGGGGIANKQDNIVILTNNNTFTGAIWVEKGTVQLDTHTNAMGASGIVNVGTNATLDLQYGAGSLRPFALNLSGTGTNAAMGAVRKTTSGSVSLRSTITLANDSKIVVTAGGFSLYSNIAAGAYTLYLSNNVSVNMQSGGEMSGSKTTGDGALRKSGSSIFTLRPASGLTGSVYLDQGEMRQGPGSDLPSGGTLTMAGGTEYSSDGTATRTVDKNVVINGGVRLACNSSGDMEFTGTVGLGGGTRVITNDNDVTLSGVISNGGLTKVGAGTMTLSGSGANTYASGTIVNAGQLDLNKTAGVNAVPGNLTIGDSSGGDIVKLQANNQIADTAIVTMNGTVVNQRGGFRLNGYSETIGGLSGDGFVEHNLDDTGVGSNHSILTINVASGAQTYDGHIRNSGGGSSGYLSLVKTGTGTQILTSASCVYTGETTIAAGTLAMSGSGYIGSTARIQIGTNATLDVTGRSSAMTLASGQGLTVLASGSANPATIAVTTSTGLNLASDSPVGFTAFSGGADDAPLQITGDDSLTLAAGNTVTVTNTGAALGEGTYKLIASGSGNTTACDGTAPGSVTVGGNGLEASHSASLAITSGELFLVVVPDAPDAPTGLDASDGTSTAHVALSWDDGDRETGYVIWRHTADVFGSATAIRTNAADTVTYNDTGASPGQLYYYWVTATNATGSSSESSSDSGWRRLEAPGNVAATDGSSTANVTITWDAATGATSYHLYRDTDSDPVGASGLGAQASGYADTSATPGQLYYYWVMASNNTSGGTSDWSTADSGYRKLAVVADVAASDDRTTDVRVTWTDGTGETGYNIWRHTADVSGSASIVGTAAADATSYDDATATAGVDYWYWVRATNSTSASMSDFSASDQGLRLLTEPAVAASNIAFSSIADTAMTVSWERGDGDYVLVVARSGSAPADPSDSTVYGADAAFGSGDSTDGGSSYVVYKGTGTSVPVTALSAGTEYFFAVYEFNGVAAPNYRTGDEPVDSQYTWAAEPTTQATNITVSGVNEVSLTGITWTNGNGAGRLMVVKAGSAVDSFPEDGETYSASATFGSGTEIGTGNFVVHDGSGPLATLSGLDRDVVYHFRVFEYNGTLGTTANFLTNAAALNPISQTTRASNPDAAVSNLTVSSIGTDQFTITWDNGTTGTNTLILVKAGGISTNPDDLSSYTANTAYGAGSQIDGASVVYNGTGGSVTVTGLTPGEHYYVKAYAFNGSAGSENYRTSDPDSADDYTLMGEPTQTTAITFSSLGTASYAVSYTAGNGLSRLVVAKEGGVVTWTPTDGTAYAGENNDFTAGTDLGSGNILVHRGASPFTLTGLSTETDYHIRIFEYQGTNATLNYNTAAAAGNPSNRYTLSTEPSAHAGSLAATALSDSEIELTWGAATGEDGFIILRRAGGAPTGTPADGTQYTQGDSIGDGTVVYVATAAGAGSVTDSYSTAASTAYYYEIYPYAYDGTAAHATYNYRTAATVPSANATTGPAEPGTSSTLISFLPASGTSATVTWTNTGAADGTIILVHSNAAVDASPSDWTGYTADTVFGAGEEIGTGNFVIFTNEVKFGDVTVTGLSAGSTYHVAVYPYNGSGAFVNYRTTSAATGSVTVLPDPSVATATADGKTLIDLAWTKHASYDVMIVHRSGTPSTAPTQGDSYSVGDACGGGTVIYKGGTNVLEHVVASGTAHHYAFYSYSGANYYSAGLTDTESTSSFGADDVVETFSYTNSTTLTGRNGETGWGGGWYGDTGSFTNSSGSFAAQTNYPTPSGNKLTTYPPNDTGVAVYRPLGQTYNSGKIYFGYILNYTWDGVNKYSGLSLYTSNTNERLFIGEIYGQDKQLGIDNTGSAVTLTNGTGHDYIIVGYYDWAAGEAKAKAFKIGLDAVPTDEPASWDVTVSKASNLVASVDSIRLASGAGSGAGTPGNTYFDEVRISTNWSDLIGVLPSKPLDPSGQTATPDGSEMVRLAWSTNAAGNGVMILHKTTAIATDPTDGTGYNVSDTIDGARVIYKGTDQAVEHVVSPGTTNNYKIYSYNTGNYYSTGVVAAATNPAYATYEKVNPFSYTNNTALGATTAGGQGFGANFWVADSGTWTVKTNYTTAVTDDTPVFFDMTDYPDMAGNLVVVSDPGNGGSATAQRSLSSAISTGTVYLTFMMSYQYYGADKWAGVSFFNGATEKAFFGKGAGANWSTLGIGDGSTTYWSAFDMGQFNSGAGDTGNVYLVVGKYEFDTKLLAAKAYKLLDGLTFPDTEPSSWDVSTTLGTAIDSIDRIKLNVGSTDGGASIGKVFFDEVRYATNWSNLLAVDCPSWAGSNTLNNAEWTAASNVWLGDFESFMFQSYPVSVGQSGGIEFDWAQDGTFSTYHDLPWLQNANNNTYWSNQLQMVSAVAVTSRFVAAGSGCAEVRTNNPALTVQNLNAPSNALAVRDAVNTNSQINLTWDRGVSGTAKDTLIIRGAPDGGAPNAYPTNGVTYNVGDPLGEGVVIYRGSGTNFSDTGLAPSTTYYYWFYSENFTYYSASHDTENENTLAGAKEIVIDGNTTDWVGSPSTVLDSSASSLQEYIWTDKKGEARTDQADYPNADITEFRVYADTDWVYFLVKMTNITDTTKPFVAIGVDTRTNSATTSMNWLGDDSGTFIGDGYAQGGAAHFPEYQLNVHHSTADGGLRIETYVHDGTSWYAPPTGGNTNVAASTTYNAIELKVARADLGLTGAVTGRFTVASFLNTGSWNNDGDGTLQVASNTADAVDAVSIPPWSTADNNAAMSAWQEDISDADIDFWVDVKFAAAGLSDNVKPSTPVLVSPTNNADVTASPTLSWQASTDSDGEVTGYLLEISTNEQFNGVSATENGPVQLRIHLDPATTNYQYTTSVSQYWWRVRARDTAGQLSTATTHTFNVVGKLDTEGPQPTLLYIGTNVAGYLAGDYDAYIAQYGYIQDVLDSEIRDSNNVFGFVIRWEDPSGVYATNKAHADLGGGPGAGEWAFNIVSDDGRVSPNWDIAEYTNGVHSRDWDIDEPFYASNTLCTGNSDVDMTNYVHAAFTMTNYDENVEYYLTVSAEDAYTEGGSWWAYGSWESYTNSAALPYYTGWCADGPNTSRNVTTNLLIRIEVRDDDIISPQATTNLAWANEASMMVSNSAGVLDYVSGTGQDILYEITDGALIGDELSFNFNAYDSFYQGVALGTNNTYVDETRTLTNTSFIAVYWQTNWINYSAARSSVGDTTDADTRLNWFWPTVTTQDVTSLWGPLGLTGPLGVTNLIQLNLFDVDNDRNGDQASGIANFGRIRLVDDDADDPGVSNLVITGTGLASEYVVTNLATWDFLDGTNSLDATTEATNVDSTAITHGGFGGTVNLGDVSSGVPDPKALSMSAAYYNSGYFRYLELGLESNPTTKTFRATSISFDSRVSNLNGPDTWEVWGSTDGFGTSNLWASGTIDLSNPDDPEGTNWTSYSSGLDMPAGDTNAVFQLHVYLADTNHLTESPGVATWYIDNLIISGYIQGEAGGTFVTDHDLARGTVRFEASLVDTNSGLYAATNSGRAPRVDFTNTTVAPITTAFFTNGLSGDGSATSPTTVWGYAPAADKAEIVAGTFPTPSNYTARFEAEDFDTDRDGDSRVTAGTSNNVPVYDDDKNAPVRGYKYGGPLGVYYNGAVTKAVSSGNTREYRINDEDLQLAASTSITVKVNLYDYSGWTVPTLSFSNSSDGVMATNPWLTALQITADTTNLPDAEMEWTFALSKASDLFDTAESVTNQFTIVSVFDKDDDREDGSSNNIDDMELADSRLGYVTFIDNDVGQANVQSNWSVSRNEWRVPQVFLGQPGDAGRENLYVSGLPASTNDGTVLANLTNRVYDSQLAAVTASDPLSVVLPTFDTGGGGQGRTIKGVQRGTSSTEASTNGGAHNITNTWITIGTAAVQNVSAYDSDMSSPLELTRIAAQFPTSTWAFTSFDYGEVGAWLPGAVVSTTNVMTAGLYDADDNRPADQKYRETPLGSLLVLDNDTVEPIAPTNVQVNGQTQTGALDRFTAPWTNTPEFQVSFKPAVDGDKAADDLDVTGIGEYRTSVTLGGIGPDTGTPLPVATDGALANYGFEMADTAWVLDGNSSYVSSPVKEGEYSLSQVNGGTAYQSNRFINAGASAPLVQASGWYQASSGATFQVEAFATNDLGTPVDTFSTNLPTAADWTYFDLGVTTILVDFGQLGKRHSVGEADSNGNWWNYITGASDTNSNMVDVDGDATTIDMTLSAFTGGGPGTYNDGLIPDSGLNGGAFAFTNVTDDAIFFPDSATPVLTLGGLDSSKTYNLTFYAARTSTFERLTTYDVGGTSVELQSSGTNLTDNWNGDTVVVLTGLVPDGGNEITVDLSATGGFGYINAMQIDSAPVVGDGTVEVLKVSLMDGGGNTTYWDDLQMSVRLLDSDGASAADVETTFIATNQGLVTNYLFAVDRDNNRASDRKASDGASFGTAYDITPPTFVDLAAGGASTDDVDDPTTQFDLTWDATDVGPDKTDDPNYPSGYSGNDVLSPWQSYKVYYGTFDALQVPGGDPGPGSGSAYIYTNFIENDAYLAWSNVVSTSSITDPSASGTNYLALTNLTQESIRLYDLDFDQDYAVVIVGIDKAGNEGPASPSSWATNNTIKFAVTQGVLRSRAEVEDAFPTNNNLRVSDKSAGALYWIAAGTTNAQGEYTSVSKDYDLIYWDAASYDESSNTTWSKVGTIRTNWFTDAPGQDNGRGTVRFYRASYKDRWRRTNVVSGLPQRPIASEEVYALHNVILSEGFNYVGLHGKPYTNTFGGVFGTDTNIWPAGASPAAGATKIEFYDSGTTAAVSDVYFFGTDSEWYESGEPSPVTDTLQASNFFLRGFSITLPTNLTGRGYATTNGWTDNAMTQTVDALVWHPILQVPTNGPGGGSYTHTINTGQRRPTPAVVYNVVALNLPVSVHPSELNLPTNFTKGPKGTADEIYTINTATKGTRNSSTIFCDSNSVWRFVTSDSLVPAGYFAPNDVIVIMSRNGGVGNSWTWTYDPTNFYNLPTRWMGE